MGALESTPARRLPSALAEYHKAFPQVSVELKTGTSDALTAAGLDRRVDAAFVAEAPASGELASYHAMVACVGVGTDIALVPESVPETMPLERLQRHALARKYSQVVTPLIWCPKEQSPALGVPVAQLRRMAKAPAVQVRPNRELVGMLRFLPQSRRVWRHRDRPASIAHARCNRPGDRRSMIDSMASSGCTNAATAWLHDADTQ